MKKFLSYCLVLMISFTAFRGLSIPVEAASTTYTYNYNFTNLDNTFIQSDIYHVAPETDATFYINITNGTGVNLYDSSTGNIASGDTVHLTFDKTYPGSVYDSINITLSHQPDIGPLVVHTIRINIAWDGVAPSGGSTVTASTNTESKNTAHSHLYSWKEEKQATEDTNGEMVYKCECGDVMYRVPTSAYYVFNKNTTEKIMKAKQGATVKIETSRWISFHKMVMQALSDRPDVSLEVSFLDGEYKGNRVFFTIPAGTDTLSLLDENGYTGFLYLAGKFGTAN